MSNQIENHFTNMGNGRRLKLYRKAIASGKISKNVSFEAFNKGLPKNKLEFFKK